MLQQTFTKVGFHIVEFIDETERFTAPAQQGVGMEPPSPPMAQLVANQVVLGSDFIERRQNFVRNMVEGRLVSILIEAVKAYATVGEIANRLRAAWGVHRELITV